MFTISFHLLERGFFPGVSGQAVRNGEGRGKGFNLNVPLARGTAGKEYVERFKTTIEQVCRVFHPSAVVVVCGADSLKGDPRGGLELTSIDMNTCVGVLKHLNVPMLVLGKA